MDTKNPNQSQPIAYRAVRGGLYVMGSSYFNIAFGFLANIFLMRILAVESYGVFALALAFAGFINVCLYLSLGSAYSQIGRSDQTSRNTLLGLNMIGVVFTLILLFPFYFIIGLLDFSGLVEQIFVVLVLLGVLQVLSSTIRIILESQLDFGITTSIEVIAFPVSYFPAFYLATRGAEVWTLVGRLACYEFILFGSLFWIMHRRGTNLFSKGFNFDRTLAWQYLKFGSSLGLVSLFQGLTGRLITFMTGKFLGEIPLGFFNRAQRTARWANQIFQAVLGRTGFHTLSRLKDDKVRRDKTIRLILWFVVNISVPVAGLIIVVAPDLIMCLYTEKWMPAAPVLRILAFYTVLSAVNSALNTLFVSAGKQRYLISRSLVTLIITLILAYPVITYWKLMGLCALLGVNTLFNTLFMLIVMHRKLKITWRIIPLRPIFSLLFLLIAYWSMNRLLPVKDLTPWGRLGLKTGLSLLAYAMIAIPLQWQQVQTNGAYLRRLFLQKEENEST